MVAKGLDFERGPLWGCLALIRCCFRRGSGRLRTFSLVTQVVGRSGRASEPGHAVIQTVDPASPVLNLAARQDYEAFCPGDRLPEAVPYPPFCAVCIAAFSGEKDGEAPAAAARFGALLGVEAQKRRSFRCAFWGPPP